MDNYEINILRRGGNWKKVKPDDLINDEKNKLKEELKIFEDEFIRKKKLAEDEINKISQEKVMIEKTINVIKNLKSF